MLANGGRLSGTSDSLKLAAVESVFAIGFRRERLAEMVDCGFGLGASLHYRALLAALTEPPNVVSARPGDYPSRSGVAARRRQ